MRLIQLIFGLLSMVFYLIHKEILGSLSLIIMATLAIIEADQERRIREAERERKARKHE